ncbi:MPPN domain protein [Dictyocaulus viviparus]|uniref:Nucleoporin NUP35 n=1 Tax=Dictyocaulus viviparus TaxID=29172 RepID=A0A0D8XV70_DICVI|nr:MPPN domain protein [Dictyocaulus viviparus]
MYSPLRNRPATMSTTLDSIPPDSTSSRIPRRLMNEEQTDSVIKTPSFLFGQKRRSAASGNQYIINPFSGQNTPSDDIFASRETGSTSGKSVHWSAALVQERSVPHESARSSLRTLSSQTTDSFSPSTNFSPGWAYLIICYIYCCIVFCVLTAPPLRSIRDDIEPARKASRRSMSIPVVNTPFPTNETAKPASEAAQSPADTWVTVYGFPPEQAGNVLKHFSRHGEIVSHQIPSRGNWMHIRYSCSVHARQALCRNASLIGNALLVGVVPCTDKDIIGTDAPQTVMSPVLSRSIVAEQSNENQISEEIPSITPEKRNQSSLEDFANPNLSVSSRAGMRSLTVYYDGHQDSKNNQPVKHDSIMNRLLTAVAL